MLHLDQMGNVFDFPIIPQRIISLVPSQTEYLCDIGLQDQIVGCTKFCIHPSHIKQKASVIGGTKTLNLTLIQSLKPDIIIGNKEENEQIQIETLQKDFPVWMSDIANLTAALEMMQKLADLFQKAKEGKQICNQIADDFAYFNQIKDPKKVLNLIWKDPYMLAGNQTFINDLLQRMGFENAANALPNPNRYPVITLSEIQQINPDIILLSSEPFPFKEKHRIAFQQLLPSASIQVVDGEMFSWYGSRLLQSAAYFKQVFLES
jgi:ABC-type Fe3+-hydroxamate transport system substrate-binding protein